MLISLWFVGPVQIRPSAERERTRACDDRLGAYTLSIYIMTTCRVVSCPEQDISLDAVAAAAAVVCRPFAVTREPNLP